LDSIKAVGNYFAMKDIISFENLFGKCFGFYIFGAFLC